MKRLLFPALLIAGCAVPTVEIPFDSDRDGLMDDEESDFGTDPTMYDTDGDSYADGLELESYTDPLDMNDHPYAGGWPIGACRDDHEGESTGWSVGAVVKNTSLPDQYGDTVRVHDFCDYPFLLTYYSES